MRGELVALDLETTGLDTLNDAIIEIGAVRMKDGEIVQEFSTLVNPNRPIPPHVTHITGISGEHVANAPEIHRVLPEIEAFVGTAPVIAHNISLDMGILRQQHGILKNNVQIDTYDLASVLLPTAPRYNLNSLASQFGIDLKHAHRALDDARATAFLYWSLWQKTKTLPASILYEISSVSQNVAWETGIVFKAALDETPGFLPGSRYEIAFISDVQPPEPLQTSETITQLDVQSVVDIVCNNGPLSREMQSFEERSQQVEMVRAITEALNDSQHLMIEAGTGTGKSIAYLTPAILWAVQNNSRVVVSTNTINLQDQLIRKEVPLLKRVLGAEFHASVMKGRSNYLCPRRLEAVRRRRPTSDVELRTLAKILVWTLESNSGDRSEINLRGAENTIWQRLSAQDEECSPLYCQSAMMGVCPFYKARKTAESAHILIVNHALLVSDASSENRVLPPFRYVIMDEAHHLEDAISNELSVHIDRATLTRRLGDLGGPAHGLLGEVLTNTRYHVQEREYLRLEQFVAVINEATTLMDVHINSLFRALRSNLVDITQNSGANEHLTLVRLEQDLRNRASFAEIHTIWKNLDEFFEVISDALLRLTKVMSKMRLENIAQLDDLIRSVETAGRYLAKLRQQLAEFIVAPDANTIYWMSISLGNDEPVLHSAPLHIGHIVEKQIWQAKESVIMTSATLRTQDSFSFIRERLNADSVRTMELGSPFNYRDSTLVYIPNDIPEPTERQGYQRAVERGIIELAAALEGRVLVLFTSYTQLRQTAQAISPRLALGDITVYDQSNGSSRESLLEGFKSTERAVLLGTKSFWEGVDIPGESLSALVITRLPFAVPTDPVFAARSETYPNGFNQYALPDAILRFRQGFGRLIRSNTDRGVVTIFDKRILSKSYGSSFLETLPDCTMRDGTLDLLPTIALDWLSRKAP